MDIHDLALAACIMLTSAAHLFLKHGSNLSRSQLSGFLNPWSVAGYVCFGMVTVLSVLAMQKISLKVLNAWSGLIYLFVVVGSVFILGERLHARQTVGIVMILVGVTLFFAL